MPNAVKTYFHLSFLIFLTLVLRLAGSAQTPDIITIKKVYTDSVFFDPEEFALYSKTSGYKNRFKTLKQCTLTYSTKRKSGVFIIKKNKLSREIKELSGLKRLEIEFKFTGIVLLADSANPIERVCPPFTITFHKAKVPIHFLFGSSGDIPLPFRSWQQLPTTITWPE